MPCYKPVKAFRGERLSSGKRSIVFVSTEARVVGDFKLPCGQCIGCRLERSRQWAMRCVDEASLYKDNSFVTLTYDDAHLPADRSLHPEDYTLFMKRLRQDVWRLSHRRGVRFFHCGEYGEQFQRPHFHACLFNLAFQDRKPWKASKSGELMYRSSTLERLWTAGFSTVSDVTFESAAYVARYCLDKVTGPNADWVSPRTGLSHYDRVLSSGEVVRVKPEYVTMSRRPGIGSGWYDKFKFDMYPSDFRIIRGMKMKPARFYDSRFESESPDVFRRIKLDRVCSVDVSDNTEDRLAVKQFCKEQSLKLLSRSLEV